MITVDTPMLRHEWRHWLRDPGIFLSTLAVPFVLTLFLEPTFRSLSVATRDPTVGIAQLVPGMMVLFAFFLVNQVGFALFREHGWGTWDRLRFAGVQPARVLASKATIPIVLGFAQGLILCVATRWLGYRPSFGPLVLVLTTHGILVIVDVAIGLLLAASLRNVQQIATFAAVGAMINGGLGGAITPTALLPGWVQPFTVLAPSHWAMRAMRAAQLDTPDRMTTVLQSWLVLVGFGVVFLFAAARRFRMDESKRSWA